MKTAAGFSASASTGGGGRAFLVGPRRRRGIMLIDALVYIALLALILGLAFAAFYQTVEHSTQLERNVAEVLRALRTGERWRNDVRSATRPPTLERGPEGLTLRIPQAKGEVSYAFRNGAVFREEAPGGRRLELLTNVKTSDFVPDRRPHVAAWRWELELQGRQKATRVHPLFTFQAIAPGQSQP